MKTTMNDNIILTDSLERELLRQELDSYSDAPLTSFVAWIGAGIKALQNKVVSIVSSASSELSAGKQGHGATAA